MVGEALGGQGVPNVVWVSLRGATGGPGVLRVVWGERGWSGGPGVIWGSWVRSGVAVFFNMFFNMGSPAGA